MAHEENTELEIRKKIKDSLSRKFPLFGGKDFEFVKVRHKRISLPELQPGSEYNFMVVKKMAGQGMLYLRMKEGRNFVVEPIEDDEFSEEEFTKVTTEDDKNNVDSTTVHSATTKEVINVDDDEKEVDMEQGANAKAKISPSAIEISPIIKEMARESFIDPVEILRFLQKNYTKGEACKLLI